MILNQSQAEAIYSAMAALNNVSCDGGRISFLGDEAREDIRVQWDDEGVSVSRGSLIVSRAVEEYPSQAEFAAAYGIAA